MARNEELAMGYAAGRTYQADIEPVTAAAAAEFHNTHGGSSFYVHGGERATQGYAVGGLEGAPEKWIEGEHLTPAQFQQHRDRVRAQVADHNAIAGSWTSEGATVLDASNAVTDKDEAKRLQKSRDERAVYNLEKAQEEDLR